MEKMNIHFDFKDSSYDAEILVEGEIGKRKFTIALHDEQLERLLRGNEGIRELDGSLQVDVLESHPDQSELKLIIASALGEHLHMRCFAGDCFLHVSNHEEGWEELHPVAHHELPRHGKTYY